MMWRDASSTLYIYICIYIIRQFVNKCRFLITVVKLCLPLSKLTVQRFARVAQKKGRNGTNKNLTLAVSRTQVPGFSSADAIATKPRVPVAGPEFLSYKLSDL